MRKKKDIDIMITIIFMLDQIKIRYFNLEGKMKKIVLGVLVVLCIFAVSIGNVEAAEKKMAANMGIGLLFPIPGSDLSDGMDFAIPLMDSFQYAVISNLSVEADMFAFLYSKSDINLTLQQFGVCARYWVTKNFNFTKGKAYEDIYLGGGLARTKFVGSDTVTTFIFKAGYILPVSVILLDLGVRYDLYDLPEFEIIDGSSITLYGMASFPF